MQDRGMEGNGEKKRRKKVVRGRERGKREKKRSLVLIPSPPPRPSPPRGGKTSPGLAAAPGGRGPATPEMSWSPQDSTETATALSPRTLWTCAMANTDLEFQTQPSPSPFSLQGFHPPAQLAAARLPLRALHPLQRTRGGHQHLPTPPRCSGCSRLQFPKLLCQSGSLLKPRQAQPSD